MNVEEIQEELERVIESLDDFIESEHRKDEEFRAAIVSDQFGDVTRHITHDPELNPPTRPLDEPEEVAWADFLYQALVLAKMRDVDLAESLRIGFDRCAENKEGYHQDSGEDMKGMVAHDVTEDGVYVGSVGDDIYISEEFTPDGEVELDSYSCIITEVGGVTCHAATIAREYGINCVVGIKNLTLGVEQGDKIIVDMSNGEVMHYEDVARDVRQD